MSLVRMDRGSRSLTIIAASALAVAAAAGPAQSQVGAIGAVPGGTVTGTDALVGTPVLVNSALTLPKDRWGFSAMGTSSSFSDAATGFELNRKVLSASAGRGIGANAMVGVQLNPYVNIEASDAFSGDFSANGR